MLEITVPILPDQGVAFGPTLISDAQGNIALMPGGTLLVSVVSGGFSASGTQAVSGGGGGPVPVTVVGTLPVTLAIAGSVSAGIGDVKIEDQSNNYAVMPSAASGKTFSTCALVVQHIDETGVPLRQSTQQAIMNSMGTLAQDTTSRSVRDSIAVVYNNQGTLASAAGQVQMAGELSAILNAQGTQSTAGLATAVGLAAVANSQGTLATSVLQTAANTTLGNISSAIAEIASNQGTQSTAGLATAAGVAVVANNEGTLVSASQFAQVTTTYGLSGTRAANALRALIGTDPNDQSTDAFGRFRVSTPDYRFDDQFQYQISPDLWDSATNSTGTVSFDSTNHMASLRCAANGTAVLQSHYHAPYTPGRGQLAIMTFILGSTPSYATSRRVGYYDGSNGIYLQQADTGVSLVLASTTSAGNQSVAQAAWNLDKMDGTGPSGVVLDLSKTQILAITLQALYSGRVVVGFDIGGVIWPVHHFLNANVQSYPYIAQASLPIRYEAQSTGSNTCSLNAICSTVMSEGGLPLTEIACRTFGTNSPIGGVTITTRRPLMSIRARTQLNGVDNTGVIVPLAVSATTAANSMLIELVRNGTLHTPSWVQVDSSNSLAEFDTSSTTISGGSTLFSGMVNVNGGAPLGLSSSLIGRLVLAYSQLLSTADILSVVATGVPATSTTVATINWGEVR